MNKQTITGDCYVEGINGANLIGITRLNKDDKDILPGQLTQLSKWIEASLINFYDSVEIYVSLDRIVINFEGAAND